MSTHNFWKESHYGQPTPIIPDENGNLSHYTGQDIVVTPIKWDDFRHGMRVRVGNPNIGLSCEGFIPAIDFSLCAGKRFKQAYSTIKCQYPVMTYVMYIDDDGTFVLSRRKLLAETYLQILTNPDDTYLAHIVGYSDHHVLAEIGYGMIVGIKLDNLTNCSLTTTAREYIADLYHKGILKEPDEIPVNITSVNENYRLNGSFRTAVKPLNLSVGELVRGKICGWNRENTGLKVELTPSSSGIVDPFCFEIYDPQKEKIYPARYKNGLKSPSLGLLEIGQTYTFKVKKVRSPYSYKLRAMPD